MVDYVGHQEIAEYLARMAGISESMARLQVMYVVDYIRMALLSGDGVRLRRLGRFYVAPVRAGVNPKASLISDGRRLRFVPSAQLFMGAKPRVIS